MHYMMHNVQPFESVAHSWYIEGGLSKVLHITWCVMCGPSKGCTRTGAYCIGPQKCWTKYGVTRQWWVSGGFNNSFNQSQRTRCHSHDFHSWINPVSSGVMCSVTTLAETVRNYVKVEWEVLETELPMDYGLESFNLLELASMIDNPSHKDIGHSFLMEGKNNLRQFENELIGCVMTDPDPMQL